jgi:ankyrin repeat protein
VHEILTMTFIYMYSIFIIVLAISICWRRYLKHAAILQHSARPTPCFESLDEYIFILRLLESSADDIRNDQQTLASEEIPMFLLEGLESAEIIINGRKSWRLVLDEGGETLIKWLLRNGADLTKLDENGKTMLHVAVEQENEPVVWLLQRLGFNMKATDSKGKTALEIATEGNMISMQSLLRGYDTDKS